MSILREARKAIFGETWALPIGVALLIGAGVVLKALAPGPWPHVGGPYLLVGAGVLLVVLVRRAS